MLRISCSLLVLTLCASAVHAQSAATQAQPRSGFSTLPPASKGFGSAPVRQAAIPGQGPARRVEQESYPVTFADEPREPAPANAAAPTDNAAPQNSRPPQQQQTAAAQPEPASTDGQNGSAPAEAQKNESSEAPAGEPNLDAGMTE